QRRIAAKVEALMERVREARRLRAEVRKDAERLMQAALAEVFPRPGQDLPEGWSWVRLGEVCETKMGGTPSTKVAEYWDPPEIVWITPEDLRKSELNRVFPSRRQISRIGLEKSSAKLLPQNTVLLSTTATIGKVGITEKPLSANQQITGIICGHNVYPEFLGYYLLKLGETGLKELGGTATATHINQANLRSLPIPLPPLEEQRRIVAYLDQVQQQVTALKRAQAETEAELKRLERAILDRAFRGEL
ncbi:MAG: restriction endonuclease subunit S, partial [Desulfotomaculales bacterium]